METKDYIADLIGRRIIHANAAYNRFDDVYQTIQDLEPDIPEDGISGFLAFNSANKTNRMKIKTGRFLHKKLKLNNGYLSENDIQSLTTIINTELFPDVEVRLDKGADITRNYRRAAGGSSCMTGSNADYTKLYESNPDRYQQLIMTQINDSARAMIIKLDNGEYLMDRVYGDSDSIIELMYEHARKNGWYYLYSSKGCKDPKDYSIFKVSRLEYEEGGIPFADTLTQYEIDGDRLNIFYEGSGDGELDSTCGGFGGGVVCCHCGDRVPEDEGYYVSDECVCLDCLSEHYDYCEDCEEHNPLDDMQLIDSEDRYVCNYCLTSNYHQCSDCNEWFKECTDVNGNEVCSDCLEDYQYCEKCGEYTKEDSVYIEDESVDVCSDCATDYQTCNCGLVYEDKSNCDCLLCKK